MQDEQSRRLKRTGTPRHTLLMIAVEEIGRKQRPALAEKLPFLPIQSLTITASTGPRHRQRM